MSRVTCCFPFLHFVLYCFQQHRQPAGITPRGGLTRPESADSRMPTQSREASRSDFMQNLSDCPSDNLLRAFGFQSMSRAQVIVMGGDGGIKLIEIQVSGGADRQHWPGPRSLLEGQRRFDISHGLARQGFVI